MRIRVTKKNIEDGVPGSGCDCPVARAIELVFPRSKVCVTPSSVGVYTSRTTKAFYFSERVSDFIVRFDKGMKVKPFSFELRT